MGAQFEGEMQALDMMGLGLRSCRGWHRGMRGLRRRQAGLGWSGLLAGALVCSGKDRRVGGKEEERRRPGPKSRGVKHDKGGRGLELRCRCTAWEDGRGAHEEEVWCRLGLSVKEGGGN